MSTSSYAIPRADARPTSLRTAFAVLVLAMLPAVLDQTVLATALPTIAGELGSIGDVSGHRLRARVDRHHAAVGQARRPARPPRAARLRALALPRRLRRLRPGAEPR